MSVGNGRVRWGVGMAGLGGAGNGRVRWGWEWKGLGAGNGMV